MMNKVCFVGRIANELKLKTLPGTEIEVLNFSLAQNRIIKRSDNDTSLFIRCTAWNKVANNMATYCQQGSLIGIEGRLDTVLRHYESGQYHEMIVVVERVSFLSKKKEEMIEEGTYEEEDYHFIDE